MDHRGPALQEGNGMQCIILAGGLGTRLRTAVPDLPKCMAPVAGETLPQSYHQLSPQAKSQLIYIFSRYMHEAIESYLHEAYPGLNYTTCIEEEPLGTGGAIRLACTKATQQNVLVLNGDTLFSIDAMKLMHFHEREMAACTLS
jgi:D-glycero-alpha-D-manno-heptose 1-phosphate guanylyltransferase